MLCFRSYKQPEIVPVDYDVIIIGGGISGLYASYKLSDHEKPLKVALFEKDDHLGGKILTKKYDNFLIEYGPLRFETGVQSKVMKLFYQLGVEVEPVVGLSQSETMPNENLMTDEEKELFKEDQSSLGYSYATRIMLMALKKVLQNQWDFEFISIHESDLEIRKSILKKHGKFNGKHLYEYGILDVFKKVLSPECLRYVIQEGYFYYMIDKNPNAAEHICILLDILEALRWEFVSVKHGVQSVVDKLYDCLHEKIDITLNTCLMKIEELTPHYKLTFGNGQIKICDHVILTVPPECLSRIDGISHIIKPILKKHLILVELFKIFVIVENPPWNEDKNTEVVSQFPCREIMTYIDESSNEGMIMFYGDERYRKYWFAVDSSIITEEQKREQLKVKIEENLKIMYPKSETWNIKVIELNDWINSSREQKGVYLWKSGINCQETIQKVSSFSMAKQSKKGIHICGETFSEYQCFMEGSIRSTEKVVSSILHLYK